MSGINPCLKVAFCYTNKMTSRSIYKLIKTKKRISADIQVNPRCYRSKSITGMRRLCQTIFDWKIIFIFILIVGLANGLLVYSQIVDQEIKLSQTLKRIRRSQPFYTKGLYLSSWTAGDLSRMNKIIDLVRQARLNTLVIDIKDSTGKVAYDSQIPQINELGTEEIRIRNLKGLLEKLYQHGIYTIARIVVLQDPELATKRPDLALKDRRNGKIWRDYKGLSWVDPASKEVWDYNIALAKEAFELGFDEVNFDYIRFPSDGDIKNIIYPFWDGVTPKAEIIRRFFEYQKVNLEKYGPRSVDLFGLTFWHTDDGSDMNIGQRLVDAIPYFDYVCPMVYPSHYPPNFEGFANPAQYPYEIIYRSLIKAKPLFNQARINAEKDADLRGRFQRESTLNQHKFALVRPWLQAFDLGAKYTPEMIRQEIKAVEDGGGYGWLFWNARNDYRVFEKVF